MRIQSLKGLHIQRIQLFRTVERQRAEPVQVMAHNAVVHDLPLSSAARIGPLRPYPGFRRRRGIPPVACGPRSEEHTSELQSLMRISYAVFCLKKKTNKSANKTMKHHNNTKST